MSVVRKVLRYLRPYRGQILLAGALVGGITALELLKPWPLKMIVDHVLGGRALPWSALAAWPPRTLLLGFCALLVLIYLLLAGVNLLSNYVTIRVGQKMVNDLRNDLYNHLQRLSLAFHSRKSSGDLLYRVTADTYAVQTLTMNGFFPALTSLLLLAGMFAVMARMDWMLTLLSLAICPALFLVIMRLSRRINRAAEVARQKESDVYSVVSRAMSAVRVIWAFTREEEERARFSAASGESLQASLRLYTWQTFYAGVINVLIALGTALVVWVGATHVLQGTLTIGGLVVFISYLASLYTPINNMSQTMGLIQGALVGAKRVFEVLETERDLQDGKRAFPSDGARGRVQFSGVSFGYSEGQPVLKGIDLEVNPGQVVAIVGPTGAGKSTLVSLIPRFYDPQQGKVLLDGVDVREFRLNSLRRQVSMVLQPPVVFPVSLRENIAYGRSGASEEEIVRAAQMAQLHGMIERLPAGYGTGVGEYGATLSEGEKQRLTIARAILRNAPILILDEPTSSVDAGTEQLLMQGLEQLMAGRTTLIIAHRLSTVRRADLIVVLRDGRIAERGGFEELLSRRGEFWSLYRLQVGSSSAVPAGA